MGFLRNRCPRCGLGAVFCGVMRMNTACTACGLSFVGDYSGARWLSYYVVLGGVGPVFGVLMWMEQPPLVAVGVPAVLAVVLMPIAVRWSTWVALRGSQDLKQKP